jgi:hypothetical protein
MKDHLKELTTLVGHPVYEEDLESLEKTDALVELNRERFAGSNSSYCEVSFSDRLSERFNFFVEKLHVLNPSPIYIWIERTNMCGTLRVPSICTINFGFEFNIERNGVFSFVTENLKDMLVMDFFISGDGEQRLDLETHGHNWGGVKY